MSLELKKRIITSFFLLSILTLMFLYNFILLIGLIFFALISWIEFYALISKILFNENYKNKILRFFYKTISLFYLSALVYLILIIQSQYIQLNIFIIYSISVSIMTDIGGLIFGKIFKGKKLTKISPKKTISGAIGSLFFSFLLIPFFMNYSSEYNFLLLFLVTFALSCISQFGDLFISFLKRKAKVKDTSDLLPGHGGVLDRIDGIIFTIPVGILIFSNL